MYKFDKETGIYTFVNGDGEIKFSCNKLAIIATSGRVVKHGPAPQLATIAAQMRQNGQQIIFVESETWDVLDLNRKTKDILPDIV